MRAAGENAYCRHTLVNISHAGRERIFEELAVVGYNREVCGKLLLPETYPDKDVRRCPGHTGQPPIPGIVRREEATPREGYIPVGFSSWRSSEKGRLCIPSFAHPGEIVAAWPPESAFARALSLPRNSLRATKAMRAVAKLLDMREAVPAELGLWGAAALEIQTGYPYTHDWSDLDILLTMRQPSGLEELRRCLSVVAALEKECAIRVDAEVTLPSGYGIPLKEVLQSGATVLGKGARDVVLMRKEEALASLGRMP